MEHNKITIIDENIVMTSSQLPFGFSLKTLNVSYLDEIHNLLNNHYIEDKQQIIRIVYSKDYLYWYLKNIPIGLIVGLIYNNKLVGMITAAIFDIAIYDSVIQIPFVNFLCLQKKIRNANLASYLINEIKNRILKREIKYAIFTSFATRIDKIKNLSELFCTIKKSAIPINYPKLKNVEFLMEDLPPIIRYNNNPFHLMQEQDIDIIVPKLNEFLKKYQLRQYFTNNSAKHYFLPKKNIVYSFVAKNNKTITDFVVIYKTYIYCLDRHKMVNVANLAYYYYESMDLTELIEYLLDKLSSYGFDQLFYSNYADNDTINFTHFDTNNDLNYHFYNTDIKNMISSDICLYAP